MTSVGFSWLPSIAVMWGFYPTIENYPQLLKKLWKDTAPFLSWSWAPNWESIITALFSGCPYLFALLRKCQWNDKPFYFSQFKIFPTYFHWMFSLVWKRLGALDWLLNIFLRLFHMWTSPSPPFPADFLHGKRVILMLTPRRWDGTAPSGPGIATEVFHYELNMGTDQ